MTDQATPTGRRPAARYRRDQPDGTWWELGWDQALGTFYAQHHPPVPYDPFTPDEPLASHGTDRHEIPTVEALASRLPVALPDHVANDLALAADAHPDIDDPPLLSAARQHIDDVDRIDGGSRSLTGDESTSASREASVPRRGAQLTDGTPSLQRSSLPAEPLAAALRTLRTDPYLAADDLDTFAQGFGLEPSLVHGALDGTLQELTVEQVAEVCEALRCSPYDVWGPELGRQILHAYGPERWPRHIEPLDDGRRHPGQDEFLHRRIEQQAPSILSLDTTALSDPQTSPVLEVTRYRQTGVLAVDPAGVARHIEDTLQPADPSAEYHFAFRQLRDPQLTQAPLSSTAFNAGCPTDHDVDPQLTALADRIDGADPGSDMIRFRDPATGAEQWIGRETPFDDWQTWDDPRSYYPGNTADVLDNAGFADPIDVPASKVTHPDPAKKMASVIDLRPVDPTAKDLDGLDLDL